jgi:hypothetical protein
VASSLACLNLSRQLQAIISWMSRNSISPGSGHHYSMADTGATGHMFPNKMAFNSYKAISNLLVWLGDNSYPPFLGRGMAIIFLNGQ